MVFARLTGLLLGLSLVVTGCGGGDDNELTGNSKPVDGGGGTAGDSGTGGTSGSDASAGTGGGTAGTGGSTGGTGGGTAGTAGTGGGSAGAAGTGGTAACPGGCDDFIDCTIDSCVKGDCAHALGPCPPGLMCDLTSGCVGAPVCASVDTCIQQWSNDPCKANVRCDDATATCAFDLLDKDADDHAPIVCGGDDCDDSDPQRNPAIAETCDGKDNDCNGAVDDGATCPGLLTCQSGACACPAANTCGAECVDKNSNPAHCGACNNPCPPSAACTGGVCTCPGTLKACGSACVNTLTDPANCGACGTVCPSGGTCQNGACACLPATPTLCGNRCVDLNTDNEHCGQCGNPCAFGNCQGAQCPVCTPGGMLILLDISGSMSSSAGSQTRLQAQLAAVQTFVQELPSANLSVGVLYFPRTNGGSALCPASNYATPDVAIDLLPGNAPAIVASMSGKTANYASVIVGPLEGAIGIVRAWQVAHPPRPGAVVMINDGGMGIGCSAESVAQATAAATAGFTGSPSVVTHVISVGDSSTGLDPQWWSAVPAAGGGTLTSTQDAGQPAILDALRNIRAGIMCP